MLYKTTISVEIITSGCFNRVQGSTKIDCIWLQKSSAVSSYFQGALIQGWWYVHVFSLLTSTCIGTCTDYMQPLEVRAHT